MLGFNLIRTPRRYPPGGAVNDALTLRNTSTREVGWGPLVPPFSPNDIAGLKLWVSGDFGVYTDAGVTLATNGQTVQQWDDQSGQINNMVQPTPIFRPIYVTSVVNGKPILRFDGIDDVIGAIYGGGVLAQPTTVVIVFNLTAGNDQVIFDSNSPTYLFENSMARGFIPLSGKMGLFATGGPLVEYNSTIIPTGFHAYSVYFNGSNTELFLDGVSQGVASTGGTASNGFNAGANAAGLGNMTGDIAEIMVYDSLLSALHIAQLDTYLGTKYGL